MLPAQLWALADVGRETELQVQGTVTLNQVLDALEARHPMLRERSVTRLRMNAGHLLFFCLWG